MPIEQKLAESLSQLFRELYDTELPPEHFNLEPTRKDVKGDLTLVVFPLVKYTRQKPEETAHRIGCYLLEHETVVASFEVIKGFLNLRLTDAWYLDQLCENLGHPDFGQLNSQQPRRIVIEYSSPNTNKPLHLGHIRNNLLGHSLSLLLQANGHQVFRVNLVNDRGIHICKSMLAWMKWGQAETPQQSGMKGDHLVGKYYVLFDQHYRQESQKLLAQGVAEKDLLQASELMKEARDLLRKWELNDKEVKYLWEMMNAWVYAGFEETYDRLGISFDKTYYESETYQLGKALIEEGLHLGVFERRPDGSVWVDLREQGLDEKLLLRSDGTSVYITQDIGTAQLRHDDYQADELIYVVGNEQNYHFEVLQKVMASLGRDWSQRIRHYSYGMVELPHGKMKSREGTVVDADDLMDEMISTARQRTEELGKLEDMDGDEAKSLFLMIGLAALKYFILKVDPKKTMMFNPEESVDFNGNTGPFIQYTHARIRSILRKAAAIGVEPIIPPPDFLLEYQEKELIKLILAYPNRVKEAGEAYSPALIANYAYELAREFNQFYHEFPILRAQNEVQRGLRLSIATLCSKAIRHAMNILGIEVPEKM